MAFENDTNRTSSKTYNLARVKIKDYNVMIDGKNFFDQIIKNEKITYENIKKKKNMLLVKEMITQLVVY